MTDAALAVPAVIPPAETRRGFPRGLVVPAVLIVLAELVFRFSGFRSDSLAPPTEVASALVRGLASGEILAPTRDTLLAAFGGLAIGGVIGLIMGIVRGSFRPVDQVMEVTTECLRPIPSVALIPVLILIFGFGYRLEMACVAFSCTWTVFVLTRSAVTGVEHRLIELSRVLRLSLVARMWKIVLPAALPRIFVAFRLAASLSLIVAVTTEIAANPLGLGYNMIIAEQTLKPDLTLAYLVWIGLIGWLLNYILITAQSRLFGPMALAEGGR